MRYQKTNTTEQNSNTVTDRATKMMSQYFFWVFTAVSLPVQNRLLYQLKVRQMVYYSLCTIQLAKIFAAFML